MKKIALITLILCLFAGYGLHAKAATARSIAGQWVMGGPVNQGKPCTIVARGNTLALINEKGEQSRGLLRGGTTIVAIDWNNLTGAITPDGQRINWANGTYWVRNAGVTGKAQTGNAPVTGQTPIQIAVGGNRNAAIKLSGAWKMGGPYNQGQACRIAQRGMALTFVNEKGVSSAGSFTSATTVTATGWRIQGRVSPDGRRIDWSNGTWWTR